MACQKKARDYHLDEKELAEIETAIRHDKHPEVRQRCTAIRLLHLGHKPAEIARMQAISIPTVYSWYNRWREAGIEGLATKPRSGRPPKAGAEYLQALEETLGKEPMSWDTISPSGPSSAYACIWKRSRA